MKRVVSVLASVAIAGLLATACSKSSPSDSAAKAAAMGPITDSGSTGLRPVAGEQVAKGEAKHGAAVFQQNCSSCHGNNGAGGGIGPALKNEKSKKKFDAAVAWIKNPQPPMPKLYPAPLSESDVNDVAAYVETL